MKENNEHKYGYARCSTTKQDALYEIEALLAKGVPRNHIYVEYISGSKTRDQRPEYDKLMTILEKNPGSEIYATDFYRIARNVHDMIDLVDIVNKYKLKLDVGDFKFDARQNEMSFIDEFILGLFGLLGNLENKAKRMSTVNSMATAKARGTHIGRYDVTKEMLENNPKFLKYYSKWKNKEISLCEFQRLYGVKSRNTCYNHIHIFEEK